MKKRTYATPSSFKQALESRVRSLSSEKNIPIDKYRQIVVYERFLARLIEVFGPSLILKGACLLYTSPSPRD